MTMFGLQCEKHGRIKIQKPGDSLLKFASRTATDEVNLNKRQATMMTVEYSNFFILFILTDELINFIQQFSFLFFRKTMSYFNSVVTLIYSST